MFSNCTTVDWQSFYSDKQDMSKPLPPSLDPDHCEMVAYSWMVCFHRSWWKIRFLRLAPLLPSAFSNSPYPLFLLSVALPLFFGAFAPADGLHLLIVPLPTFSVKFEMFVFALRQGHERGTNFAYLWFLFGLLWVVCNKILPVKA